MTTGIAARPFSGVEGPGRAALALAALCSAAGQLTGWQELLWLGLLALASFVACDWIRVRSSGRTVMALALTLSAVTAALLPAARPVILSAATQGLGFTALLVALATLRPAMQRSRLLAQAAAWLIGRPRGQRYASVTYGGHGLALIFNVGVLQLIGDILAAARLDFARHPTARHLLMATMRGSAAIALWSPLAMGFAVVTSSFAELDPLAYIALGMALALVLLGTGCLLPRHDRAETLDLPSDGNARAMALLLLGALTLLATTSALYLFAGLSFLTATTLVVPVFALVWIRLEPDADGARAAPAALASRLSDLRNEMFIFAGSTVIGALAALLFTLYGPQSIIAFDSPLMPVAVLLTIWGLSVISTPPSIPVILIAQLMATSPLAQGHALSLAMALSAGWSLGMMVSPVSATLLLSARIAGEPARRIAWDWNRAYTAIAVPLTSAALALTYLLE